MISQKIRQNYSLNRFHQVKEYTSSFWGLAYRWNFHLLFKMGEHFFLQLDRYHQEVSQISSKLRHFIFVKLCCFQFEYWILYLISFSIQISAILFLSLPNKLYPSHWSLSNWWHKLDLFVCPNFLRNLKFNEIHMNVLSLQNCVFNRTDVCTKDKIFDIQL